MNHCCGRFHHSIDSCWTTMEITFRNLLCVLKIWRINETQVGRLPLQWEVHCRRCRGNFSPANISTSDQRCFNVVDQRWNNIDPTLKMKQNPTSDFQRCTTLIQRQCSTLKQRWNNVTQRWYNVVSPYRGN